MEDEHSWSWEFIRRELIKKEWKVIIKNLKEDGDEMKNIRRTGKEPQGKFCKVEVEVKVKPPPASTS